MPLYTTKIGFPAFMWQNSPISKDIRDKNSLKDPHSFCTEVLSRFAPECTTDFSIPEVVVVVQNRMFTNTNVPLNMGTVKPATNVSLWFCVSVRISPAESHQMIHLNILCLMWPTRCFQEIQKQARKISPLIQAQL